MRIHDLIEKYDLEVELGEPNERSSMELLVDVLDVVLEKIKIPERKEETIRFDPETGNVYIKEGDEWKEYGSPFEFARVREWGGECVHKEEKFNNNEQEVKVNPVHEGVLLKESYDLCVLGEPDEHTVYEYPCLHDLQRRGHMLQQ